MFYLIVIVGGAVLIAIFNTLPAFSLTLLLHNALATAIGVISIIALDGIGALILRRLTPTAWYHPKKRLFSVSKGEREFYRKLEIKKWKGLIPELGIFTGFSKSEIKDSNDPIYLEKYLIESNYGVIIHLENAILGFLILFIPLCSSQSIWIPIYVINFILSLLPVMILRYTSHTLQKLYKKALKTELK